MLVLRILHFYKDFDPLYNFQPWIHNTFFQDFILNSCQGASEPPRTTWLLFYVFKLQQTSPDIGSGKVAVTVTILS